MRHFLNLGLLISIESIYYLYFKPSSNAMFFLFWFIVGVVLTVIALLRGFQSQSDVVNKESVEDLFKEIIGQADMRRKDPIKENRRINQIAIGAWILFDIINVSFYLIMRT